MFTRSGQTWAQQGAKLTGAGESGAGGFGTGVALSTDGNTALVGGQHDDGGRGAAWVFVRSGQTWAAQGPKLGPGGTSASSFGQSVALSGDGNTALAGGFSDSIGVGAAWVFTRSAQTWTQQGPKLSIGQTGAPRFGESVSMSADGTIALIGGPDDNGGVGAAWLVGRAGERWALEGPRLTGSGRIGAAKFGQSVALSADGSTALVGAPQDNGNVGAAWVFAFSGGSWVQQGPKLTGATGAAGFGWSVALSADGNTAVVGGPADNGNAGAAWVFTRSGQTWTQQGSKLTGAGQFGYSVAVSAAGNTALIGAPFDGDVGAAWVFTRSGQTWTQQGSKLTGAGGAFDPAFGAAVALSSDGNTALIGGPEDNADAGAAWVFTRSGQTWAQQGSKLTGSGPCTQSLFGWSVALSGEGNTALIGGPDDGCAPEGALPGTGAAWAFTRSDTTWTQLGSKFRPSNATGFGSGFGSGVALSGDGRRAVVGGPHDRGQLGVTPFSGAAWAFISREPPAITSAATTTLRTGQAGSFTVTTSGFPAAALSVQGALPAGVSFTDAGDGTATLAGTPAAGTGGVYRLTITAANGASAEATQEFTLTVEQPPAITSAPATTFRTGQAGSFTVTSSGAPVAALSVQGALPAGVSFTDAGDGTATLAGTPAAGTSGLYRLIITAANGASPAATQQFTLTVTEPPAISAAGAQFTTGRAGSFTVTSSGFPAPALSVQGALPAGVSFTDNGDGTATLDGYAAAGTAGGYRLTITAANGVSPDATQDITLTVVQPPTITSSAGAGWATGQAESFTVTTDGFPAPALSVDGALPEGVSFTDAGDGTATLAGTPEAGAGGVYRLMITAANGVSPPATQEYTLTVFQPAAITSAAVATFTTGQAGSFEVTSTGFRAPALSVEGALPAGVTFADEGDGTATLAGTPAAGAGGVYRLTITAANDLPPAATQEFTLTVFQPPAITSAAAAPFTTGQAGSFTVTSSGFPAPALSIDGALPAGVSFTDAGDGSASLAGTPAAGSGGVYRLTITAANGMSPPATQEYTLTVFQRPAITSAAATTFTTGQAGGFTVESSGFPVAALSVEGALPAGVSFTDEGDGTATLAGTPEAGTRGVYRLTITAANGVSPDATQEFDITVAPAPLPQQPLPPPPSSSSPPSPAPAPADLRLQALGLSVFGPNGSRARCRMSSGRIRACTVRLVRGGRVLAKGRARRPAEARSLTVALQLTSRGRALLAERLGGVRARLRARALTSDGMRRASARTRGILQLERFTTPPGSWLPGEAALSVRGERFRRSLQHKLIAVAALRCEGYSARVGEPVTASGPLSLARAALLCRALARFAGPGVRLNVVGHGTAAPIAPSDTESGRATNRRVIVTVKHRPRRLRR